MEKIVILSIHGIGDAIMLTPMIQLLGEKRPGSKITVLTTLEGSKQIFESCPYISEIVKIDRSFNNIGHKLKLFVSLMRRKFDVCLTGFSSNFVDNIFAGVIQAKYRIIHSHPMMKKVMGLSFTHNIRVAMNSNEHAVHQNLSLLKPLDIYHKNEANYNTRIWISKKDVTASQKILKSHGVNEKEMLIGFHPGSSDEWGMIYKRWPKEKFAELGNRLLTEYPDARLLLFGGLNEKRLRFDIYNMMNIKPIVIDGTTIREAAALISKCNVFVSNDSGLMHVAAAMKTPTVAIFGPTNPVATSPYG
ncbi:hypothetical protein GF312_19530 [Candidatus Poribacteria bacterium]|nr:hypothetical protein [Candidatus Poribacteria bacterium]